MNPSLVENQTEIEWTEEMREVPCGLTTQLHRNQRWNILSNKGLRRWKTKVSHVHIYPLDYFLIGYLSPYIYLYMEPPSLRQSYETLPVVAIEFSTLCATNYWSHIDLLDTFLHLWPWRAAIFCHYYERLPYIAEHRQRHSTETENVI